MRTIAYKCTCKTYKQINELLWLTKYLNQQQQMLHSYVTCFPLNYSFITYYATVNTRISTSFGNFHQASSCLWNLQNLSISHTLSTKCLLLQQITIKQQAVYMLSRSVLYDAEEYIVYPIAITVNIFFLSPHDI